MCRDKFASEDDEAQYWLGILRDGPNYLKSDARLALAGIFERRGMFTEASELLDSCIAAGLKRPEVFERLARLYDQLGDEPNAARVRADAYAHESQRAETKRALRREVKRTNAEARAHAGDYFAYAITSIFLGIVVTVGTYWLASQAAGGQYLILYGPIIFGVVLLFRGVAALFPRKDL